MHATNSLVPIQADVCYPLPLFSDSVGLGRAALATARRNGLTIRKVGNRKYILGRDWLQYVAEHGETDETAELDAMTPAEAKTIIAMHQRGDAITQISSAMHLPERLIRQVIETGILQRDDRQPSWRNQ